MAILTEKTRSFEFLIEPANGDRSFEEVTVIATGAELLPGAVLGKVAVGAATAAAQAGNTGNATISAVTVGSKAQAGVYIVEFTAATAFIVIAPDGDQVGNGVTGVAFSVTDHIDFTITAGGTPMVAGDGFNVTVAAGSGAYVAYAAGASNGSEDVAGVLCIGVASGVTTKRAVVVRDATVKKYKLVYTGTEATVLAGLEALGIVAR